MARLINAEATVVPPDTLLHSKAVQKRLNNFKHELRRKENVLSAWTTDYSEIQSRNKQNTEHLVELDKVLTIFAENDFIREDSFALQTLQSQRNTTHTSLTKGLSQIDRLIEDISEQKKAIETLKNSIWVLENDTDSALSAHAFLQLVQQHPLVSPSRRHTPKLFSTLGNGPVLQFRTNPIKCVAKHIEMYPTILNREIEPFIILPPIKIEIDLSNSKIRCFATPRMGKRNGYCRYAPHPHILRHNAPCLGDFASNISEALDGNDILSALDALQLFLEQATLSDGAGRSWLYTWANKFPHGGALGPFNLDDISREPYSVVYEPDPSGGLTTRRSRHSIGSTDANAFFIKQLCLEDIRQNCASFYLPVRWPHIYDRIIIIQYIPESGDFFHNSVHVLPPDDFFI